MPVIHRKSKSTGLKFKGFVYSDPNKNKGIIDYKNVKLLRCYITAEGKILPRRISRLTAKQQRFIAKAVKSARIAGFIPFVNQISKSELERTKSL